MIRVASLICLVWSSQGWFWVGNSTRSLPERGPWQTWARESFPNLSDTLDTLGDRWETLQPMGWTFEVPSWDQVLWTIGDTLIGSFGWIFFGNAWGDVRSGLRRILQVGGILCLCLVAHYVWAVCYPAVSLLVGIVLTVVWVFRAILKLAGKILFYAQKLAGGAPEAVDVGYIGPSTGKSPETSELRQFKPTGSATKLVAVKRNGSVAVFQVGTEVPSIRSHGIYLPVEPDTIRGSAELVQHLRGHDRVHLCRNEICTEEGGQHFTIYGVVKKLDPQRFQLATAEEGAREAGRTMWSWLTGSGARVQQLATKVREMASESECEDETVPCHAALIGWEDEAGGSRLCESSCTVRGSEFSMLLQEDCPAGVAKVGLCSQHAAQYLRTRYTQKCSYGDCQRLGFESKGIRLCSSHQHPVTSAKKPEERGGRTTSMTRRSRSRSRQRSTEDVDEKEEHDADDGDFETITENDAENSKERAKRLLQEVVEDEYQTPRPKRLASSRSPGHTPKSAIHRNLAKIGMLDSPPADEGRGLLQEFCECLAETKPMGWTEDRVRDSLCGRLVKNPEELLHQLIAEAETEQARGQKGLTKFLMRWRQELKRLEDAKGRKADSEWSVIGQSQRSTPVTSPEQFEVPAFPPPPGLSGHGRDEKAEGVVRIGAPTVYKADRKAGAGEEPVGREPMAQIARAIQHQTAELASLVKQQAETAPHAAGTLKGLGKQAEEVVFLMRACGQYDVQLGQGEHGQALANTLLAAQVGASTKLRNAGFRQKMTNRLAVGIAGAHWGTHERFCLSVADFLTYTDAELDAFASEAKGAKGSDQRPTPPQRLDDWIARTKRQNDTWCLVYGAEWRDVRHNAMETLAEWHLAQPHRWPLNVIMDIWEELHWRIGEEFRELLRQLKKFANRETMTLTELRFHALLPGTDGAAWLVMPSTFDIERPGSWFQEEVVPRIERKQERLLWNLTWQGGGRKPPATPAGGGLPSGGGGADHDTKPTTKSVWGPKLTAEETNRAKERAPLDRNGVLLCWGHLCRIGCDVQGCQRSHENLRGTFEALDPCVQMQLLRRGGLKRMKAETKDTVTAKIKELRSLVAKDKSDKIGDGKKKAQSRPLKKEEQEDWRMQRSM